MTENFKVTLHMVSSLDGKIARPDNSVAWFETSSPYEQGVIGQDPEEFLKTIDCYVMGSHTYEHALELSKNYGWAYGDKPTVVTTSRNLTPERSSVTCYDGDLGELVSQLKIKYNHVWVAGGAKLARSFIQQQLVDDIRVSVLPILLGAGTPFFDHLDREQLLNLKDVTAYKNGMVELWYTVRKG